MGWGGCSMTILIYLALLVSSLFHDALGLSIIGKSKCLELVNLLNKMNFNISEVSYLVHDTLLRVRDIGEVSFIHNFLAHSIPKKTLDEQMSSLLHSPHP